MLKWDLNLGLLALNPNIYSKAISKDFQKEVPKLEAWKVIYDQWKDQPYSTRFIVDYIEIIQTMPLLTDFKDLFVAAMPIIFLFWYLTINSRGLDKDSLWFSFLFLLWMQDLTSLALCHWTNVWILLLAGLKYPANYAGHKCDINGYEDLSKLSFWNSVTIEDDSCGFEPCWFVELDEKFSNHGGQILDDLLAGFLDSHCGTVPAWMSIHATYNLTAKKGIHENEWGFHRGHVSNVLSLCQLFCGCSANK